MRLFPSSLPPPLYPSFVPVLAPIAYTLYIGAWVELYRMVRQAIQLCEVTYIRLLFRVGIKVVDEWQKSLDYVRGSNIYVRGYLD